MTENRRANFGRFAGSDYVYTGTSRKRHTKKKVTERTSFACVHMVHCVKPSLQPERFENDS